MDAIKAVLLGGFGLAADNWEALADALIRHAGKREIAQARAIEAVAQ
jgi:hypothetical protein